ncbi:DGQHR domain-containing protein [Paenibacillus amylolyticus]|uniref:DGQHR domain-containing protein n=1 Tax=Paenibacillus amylolyticus TaxID=1451 RepID=UPI000FDC6F68|nr:DGQHR domain-containing protein [Paenibacillus amylolyticus]
MNKEYIRIQQGDVTMYSISLSIEDLITRTNVEYYNSDSGEGYQRPLVPAHYRRIATYLEKSENPVLPTAILTAVNPEQIKEGRTLVIDGNLRVVDGQHRIEGIKYIAKYNQEAFLKIKDYIFPSLVMVISEEQKIHEINAFININKAGKPVSTDLAVQLKEKIRKENIDLTKENLYESVATRVSEELNKYKHSVWFDLIRLGDQPAKGKSISINAFHQSLIDLVHTYIFVNQLHVKSFKDVEEIVSELTEIINDVWRGIENRWRQCFKYESQLNIKKYNIQKGIGVFSLHIVLNEIILKNRQHNEVMKKFNKVLMQSQVQEDDWLVGGRFSTYNSSSGFRKIAQYIFNDEDLSEDFE